MQSGKLKEVLKKTGFLVTFYRSQNIIGKRFNTPQKTPQKILTGLENKILKAIISNPRTSRREIAEILKLGQDTVKEYLERLKKKKIIKRVGPAKGGYWKLMDN